MNNLYFLFIYSHSIFKHQSKTAGLVCSTDRCAHSPLFQWAVRKDMVNSTCTKSFFQFSRATTTLSVQFPESNLTKSTSLTKRGNISLSICLVARINVGISINIPTCFHSDLVFSRVVFTVARQRRRAIVRAPSWTTLPSVRKIRHKSYFLPEILNSFCTSFARKQDCHFFSKYRFQCSLVKYLGGSHEPEENIPIQQQQ